MVFQHSLNWSWPANEFVGLVGLRRLNRMPGARANQGKLPFDRYAPLTPVYTESVDKCHNIFMVCIHRPENSAQNCNLQITFDILVCSNLKVTGQMQSRGLRNLPCLLRRLANCGWLIVARVFNRDVYKVCSKGSLLLIARKHRHFPAYRSPHFKLLVSRLSTMPTRKESRNLPFVSFTNSLLRGHS